MATQTQNTLPNATSSTFNTDLQAFLRDEAADRFDDMFIDFVVSGGTHGTGASLTQTPASLTAYCGGYYITETGSITYPDDATHIYVVAHKDTTTAVTNWTRETGTHYLYRSGTAAEPSLPADCCWLMKVTTASGSVSTVSDRRFLFPYPLHTAQTAAPTVTDDASKGFFVGYEWIDETNDKAYKCLDSTTGAAVWREMSGVLSSQTTGVGTDADTSEKDLLTYSLPANSLQVTGQGVRIKAWGSTAANGNTKRGRLYFGGTAILDSTALAANDKDWYLEAVVMRTGSSTQDYFANGVFNSALIEPNFGTLSITDTAAIEIKVTGLNGTASASDIVAEGILVEYLG